MNTAFARSRFRRWLAALLAVLIGLGPIATPSYAALTLLADEPLNVTNTAKPNIVLTVDDSTSMLFDFLPDYVINTYCRDGTGKMASACGEAGQANDFGQFGKFLSPGYIGQQFKVPYSTYATTTAYSDSGPGAGCDTTAFPPRCSGGVDPTAGNTVPQGIERYPVTSPKGGSMYEYWSLWPAPVHNSAFNRLYYNPTLTYLPPVAADGTSFPSMNAVNSLVWTKVPADPWATTKSYVDLTSQVTVGLWCNSDWTQGINPATNKPFVADPSFCRTNGVVAPASQGAAAADGDYTYPWLPPGINANNPPNIALSIAYSKVDAAGQPTAAYVTSKDPKYFYENDNVIWCNTKSPLWPQGGTQVVQACNGVTYQTCGGGTSQTCGGGTQQTCSSVTQSCNGAVGQTCQNISSPQTCSNSKSQTCSGSQSQTCVGDKNDSCNGNNPQICKGYVAQSCGGINLQSCNGVQNQVCTNMKPATTGCTTAYEPPGCNTCVGPECPTCTLKTTCPLVGNCSVQTNQTCTTNADCPVISGTCSATGATCTSSLQCPSAGKCTASGATCTSNAQCPDIQGTCDRDGKQCTVNGDCQKYGYCNIQANICFGNADCPTIPGQCSVTNKSCTSNAQCPTVSGQCTITKAACLSDAQCPNTNGTCTVTGALCTSNAQCGPTGQCSATGAICQVNSQCPTIAGKCSVTQSACSTQTDCAVVPGSCSITGVACTAANQCPNVNMKCSVDGNACSSNGNCPVVGATCSTDKKACTTNADCNPVAGICSYTGLACTSGSQCPNISTASANATCSDYLSNGSMTLLAEAAGAGIVCRRNNQAYSGVSASRYNYPDSTYNFPVTGGLGSTVPWVEDDIPFGGIPTGTNEGWSWVTANPAPYSGSRAHQSAVVAGIHQHYFYNAGTTMAVGVGDMLYAWVYLDPANPPNEVMLQWYDQWGSWEHRAYWGSNVIPWGNDNTVSRQYMGPLPPMGQWVRLIVPAAKVGLEGIVVNGMAYTLNNGRATFDQAGKAVSAVQGGGNPVDACMPSPRFANIPHHYWKTSVEWCDKAVATAGDKWAGYGTSTGGSCQSFKDSTHVYPRFYKFGAAAGTDNYATPAFERVDLDIAKRATASYTHTWKDATGTVQTVTRTFDEEMENYANWFAYYRTRIQAVKAVTSLVFNELDDTYRVGFHTLSNKPATSFVNVDDFTPAQKTAWWTQLFAVNIKLNQETPNLDAITRVGEYYLNGGNPDLSGASDPIVLSCQKNWHMLFTDGLTNQQQIPTTTVPNEDATIPSLPETVLGLTPGQPWPPLYRENPKPSYNSASDYITYYWVTDMRPGTTGVAVNNVPSSAVDPATWQHQNFAAMSLGTEGKLPAGSQKTTEGLLATGTLLWPQPYPNVYKPDESGVDDLWHAAINGRGRFVNAKSADELKLGMGQILADITNQGGTRAGVEYENVNLSGTKAYFYRVAFEPGWGGTVKKVEFDPTNLIDTNGKLKETAIIWEASAQLTNMVTPSPGNPTPWMKDRKMATMDASGVAIPFQWANLSTSQRDSLAPGKPARGQLILEFLRGDRSKEGIELGQFRARTSPLGDIVNAQAKYVAAPNASYDDANDPGYSAFVSANSSRPGRVYVASNDGMVHAFDAATGDETWAYVPRALFRAGSTGLGALSYQDGALPAFRHHFYVDSTPRAVDVDFAAGGGDWRTLLIGGLAKGGRSYYAIDVTDPASVTSEAELVKKIKWEFSDPDMGYTYGKPIITKTHAKAWGNKWVAIIPAGYNNASGEGKLFFVDVATGAKLLEISTNFGDATSPAGLAHITGYTTDIRNQLTDQVYGGDLYGNVWRFDLSSENITDWSKSVTKIATLTDTSGGLQPVTTPPAIGVDIATGTNRWVFVGTGRLLHATDLKNTQRQTMYAIMDGTADAPDLNKFKNGPVGRGNLDKVTGPSALPAAPANGWLHDLPLGERIVVAPKAVLSDVAYAGTLPQNDPCITGQPANVYVRDFSLGESQLTDTSASGKLSDTLVNSLPVSDGAAALEVLGTGGGTGSTSAFPTLHLAVPTDNGNVQLARLREPKLFTAHRMSWRLLGE